MRKQISAAIAGLALASFAPAARAQDTGNPNQMGGSDTMKGQKGAMGDTSMNKTGKADEPKKHLSEIDVYLRDAMNNAKVLYSETQMAPGSLDKVIEREGVNNIDKAISSALSHIGHIKALPEAHVADMAKVDALQKDLTLAKSSVGQLRSAVSGKDNDRVMSLTSQLFAQLRTADDDFSTIAEKQNLTRVDKIMVPERQPVGGTINQPSDNPSLNQPSPGSKMDHETKPLGEPGEKPVPNPPAGGGY